MTSTLSQLLIQAADAHPDRPAVSSASGELTYRELRDQSMRLAGALVEHGIKPGDRVAISLPKEVALPIAIFGTLLAGGAYVPIDYLTPPARAHTIAVDAEPVAVISNWRSMQAIVLGDPAQASNGPKDNALHWLGPGWFEREPSAERQPVSTSLAQLQQQDQHQGQLRSPVEVPASALAYILYTSGSTGQPKGVAHTHASALAFVQWAVQTVGLKETDVVSQHASPSFDLSTFDFFGAAAAAARLALVPASTFGRVASLCRFIVSSGVTVWYSVPSALLRASAADALAVLKNSALRQLIFAGEEIPVGPLRSLWPNLPPSCRVANWYGPTETNVCTFHDLTALDVEGARPIPIGMPCPYATASLAGEGDDESDGTVGELLIAGDSLMSEYWKRPAATAQKFSAGPQRPDGRPYYATGDLVARDDTVGFTFLGRVDRQLKVRGYRVQPEEVEHALEQLAEIDEAAVVKHRKGEAEVLAAVVRVASEITLDHDAVIGHCSRLLPPYMVPDVVLPVAELPLGPRGKADYKAVLELLESSDPRPSVEAAGTSPKSARSSVLAQ
ncbi:MAG TPA: amino acid adenylation domain-containing protein [Streptosporangiaceae bacterium]|nr:amino acid adenylation domain-containing protein [Streptosporangiaceae bacterium]